MSKYLRAALLGLITGVAGIILALSGLWTAEELSWLLNLRGPIAPPSEVVVIAINQKTTDQLGQSEDINRWPRSLHARLIDRLVSRGVSAIVFDIAFLEPRSSDDDGALATAMVRASRVVLHETIDRDYLGPDGRFMRDHLFYPIQRLRDAAKGLGPFPLPNISDPVDQFWAFKEVGGEQPTLPAVALQLHALRVFHPFMKLLKYAGFQLGGLPQSPAEIKNAEDLSSFMRHLHLEFKNNPQRCARLSAALQSSDNQKFSGAEHKLLTALVKLYGGQDSYYVNFYGPAATIPTISYCDVLTDNNLKTPKKKEPDLFGKVAFVGKSESTKAIQVDGYHTAFSREDGIDLSGVEIAATAFANLLTGQSLQPHITLNLGILLLFGFIIGNLAYLAPGIRALVLTIFVGAIYFCLAWFLFIGRNLWIPVCIPVLFQLPIALFLGLFCQYRSAKNERERLIPWVPDKIADVPEAGLVFGACLLTDIQGSRVLSSRLSALEYNSLMESYYDRIKQPVKSNGGRIWDFSGDGMMCLFTAQQPESALRLRTCLAALGIMEEVELFNQRQIEDKRAPTRIGLHAGWMELGGKTLGDVGNTVSSIERLNKRLATNILASQPVVEGFNELLPMEPADSGGDSLLLRRLGSFVLPAKSDPLAIYEVIGLRKNLAEMRLRLYKLFAAALAVFEERRWAEAAGMFQEIAAAYPEDGPAKYFLEKCHEYCSKPPPPDAIVSLKIEI